MAAIDAGEIPQIDRGHRRLLQKFFSHQAFSQSSSAVSIWCR